MKSTQLILMILTFIMCLNAIYSIKNLQVSKSASSASKSASSQASKSASSSSGSSSSSSSSSSSTSSSTPSKPKLAPPDVGEIWDDLFTQPRTTSCRAEIEKQKILEQIKAESARKYGGEILINDSKFAWVLKWGFGPVSYLFDYFDPVFRDPIVKEFHSIHKAVMKEDPENTPNYKDPFDLATKIANAAPEQQEALMRELKKFKKVYDPVVFKLSANAVQIYKSMKKFSWFIDPSVADYASDFVERYDINHDGRLSPRELVLGSIIFNKGILGSKRCKHCYSEIARRIGALFTYLDCGEIGFINADQLWKGLPSLRRPTTKWNIFGFHNSDNIRTNAINDFILKNQKAKDAYVSKEEFITGILLGIWDRQCADNAIVSDNSRNLKKLRWSNNEMRDTVAYNYVKDVTKKRIEDEERERYQRYMRIKKEKEREAQIRMAKELGMPAGGAGGASQSGMVAP